MVAVNNICTKGIDVGDQMASKYSIAQGSKVWYRKVFCFLFNLIIINTLAVHCALGETTTQKTFWLSLSWALLETSELETTL